MSQECWQDVPNFWLCLKSSWSPEAGHNKAGLSDFRNQQFEADAGTCGKCGKSLSPSEKQGSEEVPQSENAENAENADRKTQKMRMTGFNVTGLR